MFAWDSTDGGSAVSASQSYAAAPSTPPTKNEPYNPYAADAKRAEEELARRRQVEKQQQQFQQQQQKLQQQLQQQYQKTPITMNGSTTPAMKPPPARVPLPPAAPQPGPPLT